MKEELGDQQSGGYVTNIKRGNEKKKKKTLHFHLTFSTSALNNIYVSIHFSKLLENGQPLYCNPAQDVFYTKNRGEGGDRESDC